MTRQTTLGLLQLFALSIAIVCVKLIRYLRREVLRSVVFVCWLINSLVRSFVNMASEVVSRKAGVGLA